LWPNLRANIQFWWRGCAGFRDWDKASHGTNANALAENHKTAFEVVRISKRQKLWVK
jgi:hypothetical protein